MGNRRRHYGGAANKAAVEGKVGEAAVVTSETTKLFLEAVGGIDDTPSPEAFVPVAVRRGVATPLRTTTDEALPKKRVGKARSKSHRPVETMTMASGGGGGIRPGQERCAEARKAEFFAEES